MDVVHGDRRPLLFDIWKETHFKTDRLAESAEVPERTVLAMLRYEFVKRTDARKVLNVLSQRLNKPLTLETVNVRVVTSQLENDPSPYFLANESFLTFSDIRKRHQFNLNRFISATGLPYPVVMAMFRFQPVARVDAERVLRKLSRMLEQDYNLSNVRIPLVYEAQEDAE